MNTALTIAGSDSSGGAGIQADIKTMTANGVFAMSAITALTAQNTTGVTDIFETTPHFLAEQLDAVFTDIFPRCREDRHGVLGGPHRDHRPTAALLRGQAHRGGPVMVATSGSKLLRDDAITALTEKLLPMAEVVTPNIPEAEILSGLTITDAAGMEAAAQKISEAYGCAVLCKGGHKVNDADDLLWRDGKAQWFHGERIAKPQHPRHRLHPFQRHCVQSGQRVRPHRLGGAGQSLHFRLLIRHARPRPRLRPHEPYV